MSDRTIIFVLGMPRSGTAALTRALSLSGAALPKGMLGASKNNPRGFWEPRAAILLNMKILRRCHSAWFNPIPPEGGYTTDRFLPEVQDYLATLPAEPVIVIKDPQITLLADLWFQAARQMGYRVGAVIATRHPRRTAHSLQRYFLNASPPFSEALWLKYYLAAERSTRDVDRVFVDFFNVTADWRRELKRIAAALNVDFTWDEGAVDAFLNPELNHHRHREQRIDDPAVAQVWRALSAAASDESWNGIDNIDCHPSREVLDEYRRIDRIYRRIPLWLSKAGIESKAALHLRRGTWA
ncbi:sulfotransferase family protein [Mycobacterium sp. E136]|uniref:sulfotransferase family protein n=1 Tax=Mycobacterium sp. E136 TaxID=1834125 RepID=UPI001E359C4B|nr:sulfotransferase family protein [Mycobacterium sp. E136]